MTSRLAFAFAISLVACGSRSGLLEPFSSSGGSGAVAGSGAQAGSGGSFGGTAGFGGGGAGGSGALGGAGTGGLAGSAGAGGSSNCLGLKLVEPILSVDSPGGFNAGDPQIVASSDSGQQVSVVFARSPAEGPLLKYDLTHATFLPWQYWPPSGLVGPTFTTFSSPDLSPDFHAGSSYIDRLSLLVAHAAQGGSPVVSFAPSVDPTSASTGPTVTLAGDDPVFVSRGQKGMHLVGIRQASSLLVHRVLYDPNGFGVDTTTLGCASFSGPAAAVPFADGWLIAHANAANAPPFGCSGVDPGPPTRIDIVALGLSGAPDYWLGVDAGAPVTELSMARHPSGAHVVFRTMSGGIIPPIRWMRVAQGGSLVGPGDVSGPNDLPLSGFATVSGGTNVFVAWGNDPAGNPPDLTLSVVSEAGAELARTAIEPPFFGALSVIASPVGSSAVVGWREAGPAGTAGVRLGRFDCAAGL